MRISQHVSCTGISSRPTLYTTEEKRIAKITDFGVACLTDASKTKTGTVLGSPYYMAPEQLAGKKVDGRADLFSLGVTLYQMLSGELPFKGESIANLMYNIANEKHPDIRRYPFRPAQLRQQHHQQGARKKKPPRVSRAASKWPRR